MSAAAEVAGVAGERQIRIRSCAGCRVRASKDDLVRIVRTGAGEAAIDPTGRLPGRGAYLCRSQSCLARALKASRLGRALRASLTQDNIDSLRAEFSKLAGPDAM